MREILFRAKVIHNHFEKPDGTYRLPQGSWVYGCLIKDCNERPMIDIQGYVDGSGVHYQYYVDPETVGQFTGLHDKNGTEIYEGDIVLMENVYRYGSCRGVVKWDDGGGWFTDYAGDYDHRIHGASGFVIGNIHDNPELLEGGGK